MPPKYPCLIAVALLSFWLRVSGLQFGLPFEYHPDEQQYIFPAMGVVSGNFEPHAHYNPTLYPYTIGLMFSLTYWTLYGLGLIPEPFNLEAAWLAPMLSWTSSMIYLARYTSVAVGVLTSLMLYHLGRRAYGRMTGLGAALIFGGTFLPAREAHFAVSDTPVALGVTVTLYLTLRILRQGCVSDYGLSGIGLGLAVATKYTAVLLALPIAVAHLLNPRYANWSDRLRSSWSVGLAGLISVAAYALVSPYTFIQFDQFWADFSENLGSAQLGFQGLELDPSGSGAVFYGKMFEWGFGWPLVGAAVVSLIVLLGRHRRVDLFMLTFPLLAFLTIQRQEMYFARWLLPLIPPLAVITAEGVRVVVTWITQARPVRFWKPDRSTGQQTNSLFLLPTSYLLLTFLLILPSTYTAVYANSIFSQTDTRTEALEWIAKNIPPNSTIAVELLGPPWGPPLAMPGLAAPSYNFVPVPDGGIMEQPLEQYRAWGVEYIIASSFHYNRPLRDKAHQASLSRNLQILNERTELIATFQPYHTEYSNFFYHDQIFGPANDVHYRQQPGPEIRVYRIRD